MSETVHSATGSSRRTGQRPMIVLDGVSKTYPKQPNPAVAELTLDVPEGAIVMLIGPSGCGKTTTLKMMNRLIEPSAGRILLDGEDVTDVNADQLRRRIGYVIQQVGLFPHLTIGDNVAVVPKMLGWDKARIANRVDELLHLVGMEPADYRDRYPRQLSGGQQQRVGVARGLAADPPVMLMDEPFGAIDPITRERLQDQFLEVQRQVAKTICFVTHDLSEAVKLGDRIAVFAPGGRLAQYDTAGNVLTHPADDFVAEFVGSGAAVRRLSLLELRHLELEEVVISSAGAPANGHPVLAVDDAGRPSAWHHVPGFAEPPPLVTVPLAGTVYDAVDLMLDARAPLVVVVDDDEQPHGTLRWGSLVNDLRTKGRRP
ncbi:MAG TPA: ATP-binding cassette domain-containing protein [Pseudonocardiaceae bacterium]|nr:ATP-binding cassette domain-containing protein [Pseudonocardiaceae bacterium]